MFSAFNESPHMGHDAHHSWPSKWPRDPESHLVNKSISPKGGRSQNCPACVNGGERVKTRGLLSKGQRWNEVDSSYELHQYLYLWYKLSSSLLTQKTSVPTDSSFRSCQEATRPGAPESGQPLSLGRTGGYNGRPVLGWSDSHEWARAATPHA